LADRRGAALRGAWLASIPSWRNGVAPVKLTPTRSVGDRSGKRSGQIFADIRLTCLPRLVFFSQIRLQINIVPTYLHAVNWNSPCPTISEAGSEDFLAMLNFISRDGWIKNNINLLMTTTDIFAVHVWALRDKLDNFVKCILE